MKIGLRDPLDRPVSLRDCLRPVAIWLGLACFFLGSIFLGDTLAARQFGDAEAFTGPVLMSLGVSLVGGGFTMDPTNRRLDPVVTFQGRQQYIVAGLSGLFLALAAIAMVLAAV